MPFGDLTTGPKRIRRPLSSSDRTPTGIYDLDFNRAFHPFCYYNPQRLSVSAARNRLAIPIRAGERMSQARH